MNKQAQSKVNKFIADNASNIAQLTKLLEDANSVTDSTSDEYRAFYKVVKFFMEEEYNCYVELAKGWQGMSTSAQGMLGFLNCVHHAFIDDGSMSWVYSTVHGTKLVTSDPYDFDDEAEYFEVMLDKNFQRNVTVHRMYTEAHVDEWLEKRRIFKKESEAKSKRFEERRERLLNKLK